MIKQILMLVAMASLLMAPHIPAHATTIDFESFADSELVTTQSPGLLFTHTQVLTAGITLDEFEFPPVSGTKVVTDNGGPITIDFAMPQDTVSGFFTYTTPLLITALDISNHVVATAMSAFTSNLALSGVSGSLPNEMLSVTFAGGITHVTVAGDPSGGSFTLDDLTFTPGVTAVPEPMTVLLVVTGLVGLMGMRVSWRHFHRE